MRLIEGILLTAVVVMATASLTDNELHQSGADGGARDLIGSDEFVGGVNADRSDIRRKRWDGGEEDELDGQETTQDDHVITKRQSQSPVARNIHAATASTPSQDLERINAGKNRVYVENKYRPVFTQCQSTALPEATPPGTVVASVRAMDNDTGPAGEIVYSILRAGSERDFDVDPVSGVIRNNKVFDRDEPAREKIAYVTVRATDKGTPPLEAICTFNVTIEDINDNLPMFDKSSYEESVPRDLEVNRTVMRIAATDIDFGPNATISYSLTAVNPADADYFAIDSNTGIIQLKKRITQNENYRFRLQAAAMDHGPHPEGSQDRSQVNVVITVASSKIKPPSFINPPMAPVSLQENYTLYKVPIASFEAQSNIAEPDLYFELVKGQTQQTNSDETFRINERGNSVDILLSKSLDFEQLTHYILTVRVKNAANVAAETVLEIFVNDVNDESPTFIAVDSGSVLENSAPHTYVLKIQATDKDGTYPNNWVRYELRDWKDKFEIDQNTGEIRTLVQLDREERKSYPLTVVAYDGNESALTMDGKPNENAKRFQIEVADVNDNPPYFPHTEYFAEIAENADIGAKVSELVALDNDTDSQLVYYITHGNPDGVFSIESQTGLLKVNKPLDYETTKAYDLIVEVDDGKQKATTKVHVKIINVNDNKPQFDNQNPTQIHGILEEQVPTRPIMKVRATDPDYDPAVATGPMTITYTLASSNVDFFRITPEGELFITRALDRDLPKGRKDWSVFVVAQDELDGIRLENTLEVIVNLDDINDNAPFLDMQPVVWYENQPPGRVSKFNATDYDEPQNGPPFHMKMADTADEAVRSAFRIEGSPTTTWHLMAIKTFDREERKEYAIPIVISDSGKPAQTATSTLTVVIGDLNDNSMYDGYSSILVYNYRGDLPDTEIGRVYVEDKDDWDLPDKSFEWHPETVPSSHFIVTSFGGFITLKKGAPGGLHQLRFRVKDRIRNEDADAKVDVHVKVIPEEAVRRSGSMRISGLTQEEFISAPSGAGSSAPLSKKETLRKRLAEIVGAKEENVDLFTVFNNNQHNDTVDVRFSAHGSPYYDPVKLNGLVADHRSNLEINIGIKIDMLGIDECLYEKQACDGSCTNRMVIMNDPHLITTNTSSFVGVDARIEAECVCAADEYLTTGITGGPCSSTACLNGGTCTGEAARPCRCPAGFNGPRCEGLDVSFSGTGWAWYEPLPTCSAGFMSLTFIAQTGNGLMLYAGPKSVPPDPSVKDFMALELREGSPVLYLDLGSGTKRLELPQSRSFVDGKAHDVEIRWTPRSVQMSIDQCPHSNQLSCTTSTALTGPSDYLNVNGPLQLGGIDSDLQKLRLALGWDSIPTDIGFSGCLQNLTFNGKTYNLFSPGHFKNATTSCDGITLPVTTGGFTTELLIILIVCLVVLVVLVLAIVAYRRRHARDNIKDFHDDIRENIINYSDEGGGEGDMTGYDLSVLRMTPDGKPLIGKSDNYDKMLNGGRAAPGEVPDISQFLDDNKGRVDRDPDGLPYDDLRHYAYEGEGNSMGSLSSLASGTEDGDLDFDCLSEFGPRFKKLADMYGDHSSESEEDDEQRQSGNESWC